MRLTLHSEAKSSQSMMQKFSWHRKTYETVPRTASVPEYGARALHESANESTSIESDCISNSISVKFKNYESNLELDDRRNHEGKTPTLNIQ